MSLKIWNSEFWWCFVLVGSNEPNLPLGARKSRNEESEFLPLFQSEAKPESLTLGESKWNSEITWNHHDRESLQIWVDVWKLCGRIHIYIYGIYIYMVYIYMVYIYMIYIYIYDIYMIYIYIWYIYMIYIYDIYIWFISYIYMIYIYDIYIYIHDIYIWYIYIYMIYIYDI